jgi:hypothetical protein
MKTKEIEINTSELKPGDLFCMRASDNSSAFYTYISSNKIKLVDSRHNKPFDPNNFLNWQTEKVYLILLKSN